MGFVVTLGLSVPLLPWFTHRGLYLFLLSLIFAFSKEEKDGGKALC